MGDRVMFGYGEIYARLCNEVGVITFVKKDGSIRRMLCTRNIDIADVLHKDREKLLYKLCGHDKRCNINNGNLAVIDMILGDSRSFNIDRLVNIEFKCGQCATEEEIMKVYSEFIEYDRAEKEKGNNRLTIDMLG